MSNKFDVSIEDYIKLTHNKKAQIRKAVVKDMCPCRVKKEIPQIWNRLLEMYDDPDPRVREQVVHTLCDGSPKSRELQVVEVLEKLWNDKDEKVRKRVRKALNSYRRTGDWNVL